MVETELNQREILEKDFSSKLRGYDPQEVDEFLDVVIRDYKVYDNYIDDLTKENERLSKGVNQMYKRLEAAMKKNEALNKKIELLEKSGATAGAAGIVQPKDTPRPAAKEKDAEADAGATRVIERPTIKQPLKGAVAASAAGAAASKASQAKPAADTPDSARPKERPSATILDILKRVSNLERAVFGDQSDESQK